MNKEEVGKEVIKVVRENVMKNRVKEGTQEIMQDGEPGKKGNVEEKEETAATKNGIQIR